MHTLAFSCIICETEVGDIMERYNLTIKDILDKQFHVDMKGYATGEVDSFLDKIIEDYEAYGAYIEELGQHLHRYEDENKKLQAKIKELEAQLNYECDKQNQVDYVDLLKRISNLEAEVFKR